jgi:hypothetical protein
VSVVAARVKQASVDQQRVHVRAQRNHRLAGAQRGHDARASHARGVRQAKLLQRALHDARRLALLPLQLRAGLQRAPQPRDVRHGVVGARLSKQRAPKLIDSTRLGGAGEGRRSAAARSAQREEREEAQAPRGVAHAGHGH